MADRPDGIVLTRHRDLAGLEHSKWWRRSLLLVLLGFLALGLANVFGQRPESTTALAAGAARLDVYAPTAVRSGLYFEARFHVDAIRELKDAKLVLDTGWLEGMTINTIEPSPIGEGSSKGRLVLDLGHVPKGQRHMLFVQLQVNPTNVGRRSQDVRLYDGDELLATVHRTITIYP